MSDQMSNPASATQTGAEFRLERRRTGWDIALGIVAIVAGLVVLGNVVVATAISILFLGWMAILGGITIFIASLMSGGDGKWWGVASGLLMGMLGVAFVSRPGLSLLGLTLIAGSMFLVGGIFRIVAAFQPGAPRGILIFSGLVTSALGLFVLTGWPYSTAWFLGTMLGVQLIVDGMTMTLVGRTRVVPTA